MDTTKKVQWKEKMKIGNKIEQKYDFLQNKSMMYLWRFWSDHKATSGICLHLWKKSK